jgi:hypothetical protein
MCWQQVGYKHVIAARIGVLIRRWTVKSLYGSLAPTLDKADK